MYLRHCLLLLFCLVLLPTNRGQAEAFYIENYNIRVSVNQDASLDIVETINVVFNQERHGVFRTIPIFYPIQSISQNEEQAKRRYRAGESDRIFVRNVRVEGHKSRTEMEGNNLKIIIGSEDTKVSGKQQYIISYKVLNAINFFSDHSEIYYDLIGTEWEVPIQNATFSVKWYSPLPADPRFFVATGQSGAKGNQTTSGIRNQQSLEGTLSHPLRPREGLTIGVYFPKGFLDDKPLTAAELADAFYIKNQQIAVQVNAEGVSEVSETYTFQALKPIKVCRNIEAAIYHQMPNPANLLGGTYQYLIDNISSESNTPSQAEGTRACFELDPKVESRASIHYKMYGNVRDGKYYFPSPNAFGEPTEQASFSFKLPDGAPAENFTFIPAIGSTTTTGGFPQKLLSETQPNGTFKTSTSGDLLLNNDFLNIDINVPKQYFTGSSSLDARLWWRNNGMLLLPLLLIGGLWKIWQRWGKEEEFTKMVHYYPPTELCPAEAGILIDDKLHDRDLIALIPHWGAQGHLKMREIENSAIMGLIKSKDYEFTLVKPLPPNTPAYQRTIFNGIFGGAACEGETVMLSSLKNKFYRAMQTARSQLEGQINQRSFYMPNTRGGAMAMLILGGIIAALGGIFSIITFTGNFNSTFFSTDLGAGLTLTGIAAVIISRYMPKKAPIGLEAYKKLVGFKMFIEDAELSRLETFLRDDPHYFDKTLPYAIVFDLADKWADKFKSLSVPPPDWYSGTAPYNTYGFMRSFDNSMRQMGEAFTSTPGQSGGSGFGGSGGASGGGFGGGGGGSW